VGTGCRRPDQVGPGIAFHVRAAARVCSRVEVDTTTCTTFGQASERCCAMPLRRRRWRRDCARSGPRSGQDGRGRESRCVPPCGPLTLARDQSPSPSGTPAHPCIAPGQRFAPTGRGLSQRVRCLSFRGCPRASSPSAGTARCSVGAVSTMNAAIEPTERGGISMPAPTPPTSSPHAAPPQSARPRTRSRSALRCTHPPARSAA